AISIAVDSNNVPYIAFSAYNTSVTQSEVYLVTKSGSSWGTPYNVSQSLTSSAYNTNPTMTIDDSDTVHIAWVWADGAKGGVKYTSKSEGTWATLLFINATEYEANHVSITLDYGNGVHIAFSQYDGTDLEIYYTKGSSSGFQTAAPVTNNNYNETTPHIAIGRGGYAFVIYTVNVAPYSVNLQVSLDPVGTGVASGSWWPWIFLGVSILMVIIVIAAVGYARQ
ncbi:MAG: hypothetical protein ACTSQY_10370, partial [Candidatus Odinarchaeia archaeon]